MKLPKINLMDGVPDKPARRRSWPSPLAMVVIFLCSFGFGRLTMSQTATVALESLAEVPIIGQMSHLIRSPDRLLGGEAEDRINILLLGVGGEGHEGPQLTDTIMFGSYQPSSAKVGLLSIPRDLSVPMGNYGWRKINAANAYGEAEASARGPFFQLSILAWIAASRAASECSSCDIQVCYHAL